MWRGGGIALRRSYPTHAERRARQRQSTAALLQLVAKQRQQLSDAAAVEEAIARDPDLRPGREVVARLSAIAPCIAAQVHSDVQGDVSRSSRLLVADDVHLMSGAAKHQYGLDKPFEKLSCAEARRLRRGRGNRKPNDRLAKDFQSSEVGADATSGLLDCGGGSPQIEGPCMGIGRGRQRQHERLPQHTVSSRYVNDNLIAQTFDKRNSQRSCLVADGSPRHRAWRSSEAGDGGPPSSHHGAGFAFRALPPLPPPLGSGMSIEKICLDDPSIVAVIRAGRCGQSFAASTLWPTQPPLQPLHVSKSTLFVQTGVQTETDAYTTVADIRDEGYGAAAAPFVDVGSCLNPYAEEFISGMSMHGRWCHEYEVDQWSTHVSAAICECPFVNDTVELLHQLIDKQELDWHVAKQRMMRDSATPKSDGNDDDRGSEVESNCSAFSFTSSLKAPETQGEYCGFCVEQDDTSHVIGDQEPEATQEHVGDTFYDGIVGIAHAVPGCGERHIGHIPIFVLSPLQNLLWNKHLNNTATWHITGKIDKRTVKAQAKAEAIAEKKRLKQRSRRARAREPITPISSYVQPVGVPYEPEGMHAKPKTAKQRTVE